MKKVSVKQNPEAPISVEILASSIVQIGQGMKRVNETRLTRGALVTLLQHDTGLGRGTVETVLGSLESLEETYLKPKKKESV